MMMFDYRLPVTIILLALPLVALAEQAKKFGDYTIHYSAFSSDNLTPEIAKKYAISRSKKLALLNISILKKNANGSSEPVQAEIKATVTNLSQQLRVLKTREISEHGAIYYIAEVPASNAESLTYNIEVTPKGSNVPYAFSFQEAFYLE